MKIPAVRYFYGASQLPEYLSVILLMRNQFALRGRVFFRILIVLGALLLLVVLAAGWFHHALRRSLPQLDGTQPVAGLSAMVTVTRDDLGVPTVRGATRLDVARALIL